VFLGYFSPVIAPDGRGRNWLRHSGVLLALLLAAVPAVGCGETIIDSQKTEEQLEANLSNSLEEKVSSVDCPSDQKVEKGATFNCSVKLQKGEEQTVTLKIRNSDADISVINVSRPNE
jgi:hypothetical protein